MSPRNRLPLRCRHGRRRLGFESLEPRELLALTVDLGVDSLFEGATLPTATVSRTGDTSQSLLVSLTSSNPTAATGPATITIPAGQASAVFTVTAPADGVVDAPLTVAFTASAPGHDPALASLVVANADVLALSPGASNDHITLTPTDEPRRYEITGATPQFWTPSIVDLAHDTPADQRTPLRLEHTGGPYDYSASLIWVDTVRPTPIPQYVIHADPAAGAVSVDDRPIAFVSYDIDQLPIESVHVARYELAVDTVLAAPVTPGDSFILIANASGWSNEPWAPADTRALAWYGYQDSTGFTYPNYSYTRHVATGGAGGLWAPGGISYDAAAGAYRIELESPWAGPALAAGAAVRNAHAGDDLSFPPATSPPAGNPTGPYAATIGGGVWQHGLRSETLFRPATAYIRPAAVSQLQWQGASIAPAADAALGPLDFTLPLAEANSTQQVVLDLNPLAKHPFGPGANVVIDSVDSPQHGTAAVAPGPAGTSLIRYASAPAYFGDDAITYALRNADTGVLFEGRIDLSIEDNTAEQRAEKLRTIALGMLNYESATNRFPIAPTAANFDSSGNPHLSWRVHILPYMGYQALYNQFRLNEPWNSPHNLPLAAQMPDVFRDPLAAADATTTRFRIISGEGPSYYWRRSNNLLVGPRHGDIRDGDQHTLLVVETGPSAAVAWTQPDLPYFNPSDPLAALGNDTSDWIHAVTMDARVLAFPKTISPAVFAGLVTVDGDELIDAPTLRREYAELRGPEAVAALDAELANWPLRQIALGFFNYESAQRRFPIGPNAAWFDLAGNPYLSWRVHILPYIGYANLYSQFRLSEPWNSPHNLPLLDLMPDVFRSPGDSSDTTSTRLQTFTGPDAPFGYQPAGANQTGPRAVDILDGFSNTILLVEAGPSTAVPWTKPADVPLDTSDPWAALGELPGGAMRTAMFDAAITTLPTNLLPVTLKALATRAGGEVVNLSALSASTPVEANLKQIALAMINWKDAHTVFSANRFAPDGTPLLSWRVSILPYLGMTALYNQFHLDEPWDSPHNLSLLEFMPDVFRAAEDPADTALTHVMTFVGPGAPFPASGTSATDGPKLSQITDGASQTYMVVEAGRNVAAPWTKPVDLPYHAANPYSQLGDVGAIFYAVYFSGAVNDESGLQSISQLASRITHQGGTSTDNPPAAPSIRQSHGDARLAEFGADWFDVVFDAPPTIPQTLMLSVSNPAVALLDKQSLTFNATNWNIPQRVIIRGIDDHELNPGRTITVTVGGQQFSATIIDDEIPPPDADFDANGAVAGHDFLAWQRGFGISLGATQAQGDANHDGAVDASDFAVWQSQFGNVALQNLQLAAVPGAFEAFGSAGSSPSTALLMAVDSAPLSGSFPSPVGQIAFVDVLSSHPAAAITNSSTIFDSTTTRALLSELLADAALATYMEPPIKTAGFSEANGRENPANDLPRASRALRDKAAPDHRPDARFAWSSPLDG